MFTSIADIQAAIFEQTGLKTSAKRMTGSMKKHFKIWPIFQEGKYPDFPHEWLNTFKGNFKGINGVFPYCTISNLSIPAEGIEFNPIAYKKERKPKPIDENSPQRTWGSKNSQLRLDKAAARYAKALRRGENRATYY